MLGRVLQGGAPQIESGPTTPNRSSLLSICAEGIFLCRPDVFRVKE